MSSILWRRILLSRFSAQSAIIFEERPQAWQPLGDLGGPRLGFYFAGGPSAYVFGGSFSSPLVQHGRSRPDHVGAFLTAPRGAERSQLDSI